MNIQTGNHLEHDAAWRVRVDQTWDRLSPLVQQVLAEPAPPAEDSDWANGTGALLFEMALDAVDRAARALQRARKPKHRRHRTRALQNITRGSADLGRRLGASLVVQARREHPDGSSELLLALVRARYMQLRDGACVQSEATS